MTFAAPTSDEWEQYDQSMWSWTTEQLHDELIKLYAELAAGILPSDVYEKAKLIVEAQLHGTKSNTSDDDYDRAMKGI